MVDDTELDLSMREADVAIRMSPPRQPDLIQRHLVSVQVHIYGSPEIPQEIRYAAATGRTRRARRLIVYGEDTRRRFRGQLAGRCRRQARPRPPSDPEREQHLRDAARRAQRARPRLASRFRGAEHSDLTRVLPEVAGPPNEAYFRLSRGTALVEADQRVSPISCCAR